MLTEKEEKFLRGYERPLQLPSWKFVLIYGLRRALPFMVVSAVASYFIDYGSAPWENLGSLVVTLGTWVVCGIFFGSFLRSAVVYRYKHLQQKRDAA